MIGPAWNPGARVLLNTEPLWGTSFDGPWTCTVVQSTATHALVVPDTPYKASDGQLIQPWVPVGLLTPQGGES